jgi:3-oxoacyl-[acyl-carrier protein] reductase
MNILITGGASGLGEAITRKLITNENDVIYFTFNGSLSKAKALENEFKNAIAIKCDFKDSSELNLLINKFDELKIDILINNAYSGTPIKTHFHKLSKEDLQSEYMNNTLPTILLTQAAIGYFRKNKKGKIITILTSFLLNTPPTGASAYVANKAFLASMVKSWATENAKFNISSNAVSPSFMQTNLSADTDERIIEQLIESHPLKKLLTIQEVAETVLFLTTASPHINGVDIVMNAGTNVK